MALSTDKQFESGHDLESGGSGWMLIRSLAAAVMLCIGGVAAQSNADTLEVPGDYATVQSAIDAALDGDEVVVSPGTYVESVNMLGKAITLRSTDPLDAATVVATRLDGTGLGASIITCNSGEGLDTIIDGLTMRRAEVASNGGGILLDGSIATIRNCRFQQNHALGDGGGLYCNSSGLIVQDCTFDRNTAINNGGGLASTGAAARIESCVFVGNETLTSDGDGGGLLCVGAKSVVQDCSFRENNSRRLGGGMHAVLTTVSGCTFEDNLCTQFGDGGGASVSACELSDCTFRRNEASGDQGGGLRADTSIVSDCQFEENTAGEGAGVYSSNSRVIDCMFTENDAAEAGGGVRAVGATIVEGCTFYRCSSTSGGGVHAYTGDSTIVNCDFINTLSGSAIWLRDTDPLISNCTFVRNFPQGIFCKGAFADIDGCTFSGHIGNGALWATQSSPRITNSIFWDNTIQIAGGGNTTARYSNIQGGFPGVGNIDVDPLFVQPLGPDGVLGTLDDDLRIVAGSPCNDAGDNGYVLADRADLDRDGDFSEPVPLDHDGNPRVTDDDNDGTPTVDMGAFELDGEVPPPCPEDIVPSGTVDVSDLLALLGSWGPCVDCDADINNDDTVDVSDLLLLLAAWGEC